MARFAPLLRALLCLLLLVNVGASAHMGARMAVDAIPAATAPRHAEAASPCHEGMRMAGMDDRQEDAGHDGMPDCCKSGNCDGFCTQQASALVWPAWRAQVVPAQAATPEYRAEGHASPRQPGRHRPPILAG